MKNDDLGPGRVHPLTDDELERLEKLAAKATPGPWVKIIRGVGQGVYAPRGEVCRNVVRATDALYIAAACNAAPSLVAEVRALRRHNQAMRGGNKFVRDSLEAENTALRERVEALEWLREVEAYDVFYDHPAHRKGRDLTDVERQACIRARAGYRLIEKAAREAVK